MICRKSSMHWGRPLFLCASIIYSLFITWLFMNHILYSLHAVLKRHLAKKNPNMFSCPSFYETFSLSFSNINHPHLFVLEKYFPQNIGFNTKHVPIVVKKYGWLDVYPTSSVVMNCFWVLFDSFLILPTTLLYIIHNYTEMRMLKLMYCQ